MILQAAQFALNAHRGQTRKYTCRPYIEHPMRVAGQVMLVTGVDPDIVAAAWLHDVVEDCGVTEAELLRAFNPVVTQLVLQGTNPSKGAEGSRAWRKSLDRAHIAKASYWAKIIKLHDRIDNIRDMAACNDGFRKKYAEETIKLCTVFTDPDWDIRELVRQLQAEVSTMMSGFYRDWIGRKVAKIARRETAPCPFKSGNKVNTVRGIIEHPQLPGEPAFVFDEDDSHVRCSICEVVV